jgi:phosphoribosylglycinamide formyltransferase-1
VANLAVFASGNGSNFQVIAEAVRGTRHSLAFLLCNKRDAYVLERARQLDVPVHLVEYAGKTREQADREILEYTEGAHIDLIALAGYMKLLTPFFLSSFKGDILNIHPSLLPKYAGVNAIERSYNAGDPELGITIIKIDNGVDTGPIVYQASFRRASNASLAEVEAEIHRLEHTHFPLVIIRELDKIEQTKQKA